MKFYDRAKELAELDRIRNRAFETNSRMTVITGRRRIGKTALALKSTEDTGPVLYLFVGRKNEKVLCSEYMNLIAEQLNIYVPPAFSNFRDLFLFLMETGKNLKYSLIIDEFQEFLNINPAVYSDIQNIWDQYKKITNVNLILMGSVFSLMHRIFEDYKEPLFGRADAIIRLKGFETSVIKEIIKDYKEDYTNDELLTLYMISGGVPRYIELLVEDTDLKVDSMLKYVVRENSLFVEEGKNLLIQEFGKDYGVYFSILTCIASGIDRQGDIEGNLGGISVAGHLKRLMEDYSLIKRIRPIMSKPLSKNVRYEIGDNFLNFWFNYFDRYQTLVEMDNFDALQKIVLSDFTTYSGKLLEKWFRQKMKESGEYKEVGQWWEKGGVDNEIDIVALGLEGRTATVAEVKRQLKKFKPELFEKKVDRIKSVALKGYDIIERVFTLEDM